MSIMVELYGKDFNPDLIETVESKITEEVRSREGLPTIVEKVYEIWVAYAGGQIWAIEAKTNDPEAHAKLKAEVIARINVAKNTIIQVE